MAVTTTRQVAIGNEQNPFQSLANVKGEAERPLLLEYLFSFCESPDLISLGKTCKLFDEVIGRIQCTYDGEQLRFHVHKQPANPLLANRINTYHILCTYARCLEKRGAEIKTKELVFDALKLKMRLGRSTNLLSSISDPRFPGEQLEWLKKIACYHEERGEYDRAEKCVAKIVSIHDFRRDYSPLPCLEGLSKRLRIDCYGRLALKCLAILHRGPSYTQIFKERLSSLNPAPLSRYYRGDHRYLIIRYYKCMDEISSLGECDFAFECIKRDARNLEAIRRKWWKSKNYYVDGHISNNVNNIGRSFIKAGRIDLAIALKELLFPNSTRLNGEIAEKYAEQGDLHKALAFYDKASRISLVPYFAKKGHFDTVFEILGPWYKEFFEVVIPAMIAFEQVEEARAQVLKSMRNIHPSRVFNTKVFSLVKFYPLHKLLYLFRCNRALLSIANAASKQGNNKLAETVLNDIESTIDSENISRHLDYFSWEGNYNSEFCILFFERAELYFSRRNSQKFKYCINQAARNLRRRSREGMKISDDAETFHSLVTKAGLDDEYRDVLQLADIKRIVTPNPSGWTEEREIEWLGWLSEEARNFNEGSLPLFKEGYSEKYKEAWLHRLKRLLVMSSQWSRGCNIRAKKTSEHITSFHRVASRISDTKTRDRAHRMISFAHKAISTSRKENPYFREFYVRNYRPKLTLYGKQKVRVTFDSFGDIHGKSELFKLSQMKNGEEVVIHTKTIRRTDREWVKYVQRSAASAERKREPDYPFRRVDIKRSRYHRLIDLRYLTETKAERAFREEMREQARALDLDSFNGL